MDFLEKSEAVVDFSRNENHLILEDVKKFLDRKLMSLAGLFIKASKEHSILSREELSRRYHFFRLEHADQSYIQVKLTASLQVSNYLNLDITTACTYVCTFVCNCVTVCWVPCTYGLTIIAVFCKCLHYIY